MFDKIVSAATNNKFPEISENFPLMLLLSGQFTTLSMTQTVIICFLLYKYVTYNLQMLRFRFQLTRNSMNRRHSHLPSLRIPALDLPLLLSKSQLLFLVCSLIFCSGSVRQSKLAISQFLRVRECALSMLLTRLLT